MYLWFRFLPIRFVAHRCGLCCRGRGFEQLAAACEFRCDVAAGQQSVMPDPDEPFRQDVHQKPANEFFGRERHLLGAILIGVVGDLPPTVLRRHQLVPVLDSS